MNRTDRLINRQKEDHPFYVAPAAEVDMIAKVAAAISAGGGLLTGAKPENLNEFGRVFETFAIPQKWNLHDTPHVMSSQQLRSKPCANLVVRRDYGALEGQQHVRQMPNRDDCVLAGQLLSRYEATRANGKPEQDGQ